MTTYEDHTYNPIFYDFSKMFEVDPLDWVILCKTCEEKVATRSKPIYEVLQKLSEVSR